MSSGPIIGALAVVDDTTPLADIFDQVARPVTWKDQRVRALRLGDHDDLTLLAAIARGATLKQLLREAA